ncbi:hypothetical protein RGE_25600 [Rubrivivax gelatinosus IL144]|uniref:Gp5/Type VI secretion system Vgr protein OB-fold domain-containing protein n=1 Tax=Rubrivivax gelatinosus (strain NBRC 100245 / IL144) TaxID=983917 RepID=I0HSB2_RUBGI|nr:hypothetical protein RGE_25600 [Rubrivivax gelatinosus IL144]
MREAAGAPIAFDRLRSQHLVGRLAPRPSVHGVQTALVVGLGEPVHSDRDHRIKIQFHWQRGTRSSHRLAHPAGDNAPASDASSTWVRVSEAVAGANWGSHFSPRLGQEVLVGFLGGDIDRPVVMGTVYNGLGRPDAQSNQTSAGAAGAGGCAPAWFPGAAAEGRLQAHQHGAVERSFLEHRAARDTVCRTFPRHLAVKRQDVVA